MRAQARTPGLDRALTRPTLRVLAEPLAVVRLAPAEPVPGWASAPAELVCLTRTANELSVVAPARVVPPEAQAEGPWLALEVAGPLSFDQVGVLAGLTQPLATADVSVFVISTYDTDYVLVRAELLERAIAALRDAGYVLSD